MKKYVAGIGLLCAALMFFSCKQPAAPKLDKISAHETIEIPSNLGKNATDTLPSGLTLGSGEELHVYAARMSGEEVSTLFGSAYYVTNSTSATLTDTDIKNIKTKLGGLFYVGDNFNIGYRVVKTANGEIVRSKVVAVKVVSPYKNYVGKNVGSLTNDPDVAFVYALGGKDAAGTDVPSAWYVKVTIKNEEFPTMTARVLLGGTKKIEDVKEEDLPYTKAEIVGSDTVFLCKVDTAKIEKGVPLHARVEFKDIEDASVNAKTVATLSLPKVDPTKPEYAWAMSVETEQNDENPLITTENPDERIVKTSVDITISNLAAELTERYVNAEVETRYRYQISTNENFDGAVWQKPEDDGSPDAYYLAKLKNLTANTVYYFRAEVTYIVTGDAMTHQYQLQKVVSPAVSFKTRDEYNTSGFVFDYSDEAHRIRKYVDATTMYWDGHYDNTPAGLLTTASSTEGSLQLDNGKTIQSKAADYKYSSGALNFKMRLPSESTIKTSIIESGSVSLIRLVDKDGKEVSGYEGTVDLAEFETDADGVKVIVRYYAPTYKASNDAPRTTPADWTLSEQGMVKLLIEANGHGNGKEIPAATAVLATTEVKLNDGAVLTSILASAVAANVKEVVFDANAWTTWADCAITFTKEKITAKVGAVSHEVSFEKSKHPDLVEEGYKQFTLTSKLGGLRVDNVKYVVTK